MSRMELQKPVTIDDMYHMPKDRQKYELVDGKIVVSAAGWPHAEIVIKIVRIIATFLVDHPIGKVYGDNAGVIFPNGNLRPIALADSTGHRERHNYCGTHPARVNVSLLAVFLN